MRKKYNIRIPKGKEVKNVKTNIVNGNIKVSFDLDDVFEPKDGDFLAVKDDGCVFIYSDAKALSRDSVCSYCGSFGNYKGSIEVRFSDNWTTKENCRIATSDEKEKFIDRLKNECGKRWNSETKKLEDIRWRAEENELYYYLIVGNPTIVKNMADTHLLFDDARYESGNYFRTYKAAKKVADQIKDIFKNSKAE